MEEDIEVTIIDPLMNFPTSDVARSTKTLSTISECDSPTMTNSRAQNNFQGANKNSRNLESCLKCFPSSKQKGDSFGSSSPPLDIDLLLRYYACNSNMERSINEVLKKAEGKCFNYPNDPLNQVCKDRDRSPLIELRALCKIFESLELSSSEDSLLSTIRVRDTLTKIQSIIGRYSEKQLEQILAHDSSITICKHCGVISCSNPQSVPIEPQRSLPRTSYFLNTQIFSSNLSDHSSKMNREMDRMNKKQAAKRVQKSNNNSLTSRRCRNGKKDCGSSEVNSNFKREDKAFGNTSRRIESMIAERENERPKEHCTMQVATEEKSSEKNENKIHDDVKSFPVKLQNYVSDLQMIKLSPSKAGKIGRARTEEITNRNESTRQRNINSNFEILAETKNPANFASFLKSLRETCKGAAELSNDASRDRPNRSQETYNETTEKVVKDIVYTKSKLQLDDSKEDIYALSNTRQDIRNKQSQSLYTSNNVAPIIAMTCLAPSRLKSVDAKKKEFVSQFDKRTRVQSRYSNNKHGFVLHASRDGNPQLDLASRMFDELRYIDINGNKKDGRMPLGDCHDYTEFWKYIELGKNKKESNSVTCLMEEDSLENCTKAFDSRVQFDRSDTTTFSSSSAENMIREWIKSSHNDDDACNKACERSVTLKPLVGKLSVQHQTPATDEKCVYCSESSIYRQCDVPIDDIYEMRHSTLSNDEIKNQSTAEVLEESKHQTSRELSNKAMNVINSQKKIDNLTAKRFFSKQFFKSLKSIKSTKSTKSDASESKANFPNLSGSKLVDDPFKNVTRRITYNKSSFRAIDSDENSLNKVPSILLLYRKLLEDTKEMDWESFQKFIEDLHPNQKHIWRDICKGIKNEATRVASRGDGITEVCIEISSVPCKEAKNEEGTCNAEIVFEMDMALGDVERFLNRKLASDEKGQLDTLKRANEVIEDQNDDVCGIEGGFDQAD
ncbi:uncharacterized protein LOC143183331 [Calliopsis andreniformis]|uniref:uncharacterized protein LOC143183331 n=1 Tax=Calliopsis andreniformis TaxID=337506 RepID=UPI003FCC5A40